MMSRLCRLKTASHGDDGQWAYEEITKLREQVAAQAALIDELQQNNSEYLLLIEAEKSEWRTAHDAALIYKYK